MKSGKTAHDLHCTVAEFCDKFHLNTSQCLQELLSFAAVYHRFHTPSSTCPKMDVVDNTHSLSDDTVDDGIAEEDDEVQRTSSRANPDQVLVNWSFLDALNLLATLPIISTMHFSRFARYSIAVAIPISTCTAERSFSALKRIKTRLRSTMAQERLEDLLMMSVERKTLSSLSCDSIIDQFARSSSELSKALL